MNGRKGTQDKERLKTEGGKDELQGEKEERKLKHGEKKEG